MVKIAIDSGHGINTAGKRCLKSLDPKETREWSLNARITSRMIELLSEYENVQVLRLDDPTGKRDVPLKERTDKANSWGADILISNHHNAGINGGSGGGLVIYRYPNSTKFTKQMQKDLYDAHIKRTGLKGNRATPLAEANFHMTRESKMAAVLIEHGFMDSKVDVPIILTQEFAFQAARGVVDFLVKQYKLKKKPEVVAPKPPTNNKGYFRVVVGSYQNRENAVAQQKKLKDKGFDSFLVWYED